MSRANQKGNNMTQCKIFSGMSADLLTRQINNWLADDKQRYISVVSQQTTIAKREQDSQVEIVVTIFYTKP